MAPPDCTVYPTNPRRATEDVLSQIVALERIQARPELDIQLSRTRLIVFLNPEETFRKGYERRW